MNIDENIKSNASIILWVSHGAVAVYLWSGNAIFGYEVKYYWMIALLALSAYMFTKLKKDIEDKQRELETQQREYNLYRKANAGKSNGNGVPLDFEDEFDIGKLSEIPK